MANENELTLRTGETPAALVKIEIRIAEHIRGAYSNMLEVGLDLIDAKEIVPHGEWESWVRANAYMSERQAQKLMQAARSVPAGSALATLEISKIQTILSLPEPEREGMARRAQDEGMTLKALREAVAKEKQRADELDRKLRNAQGINRGIDREVRAQLEVARSEADRLREQLADAQRQSAQGISAEAQEQIDALRRELQRAEDVADEQAALRADAQARLLNMQAQAARMPGGEAARFDLPGAVRAFIGSAGVLPHMGPQIAAMSEARRQELREYVDMVAAWVDDARRALAERAQAV